MLEFKSPKPSNLPKFAPIKILAVFITIMATLSIGATLASNINLNSGAPVEFGQGVTLAAACDSEITVTPQTSYTNGAAPISIIMNDPASAGDTHIIDQNQNSGVWHKGMLLSGPGVDSGTYITNVDDAGSGLYGTINLSKPLISNIDAGVTLQAQFKGFYFTSVTVSDVSSDCNGKTFSIKAFKNGANSPLDLYETDGINIHNSIEVYDSNGTFSLIGAGLLADDISNITNGFKVTLQTIGPPPSVAISSAQDVDRISIESKTIGLLSGRVLTGTHLGIYVPSMYLHSGFNRTLSGGNFTGSCSEPQCIAFLTFSDWAAHLLDSDVTAFNLEFASFHNGTMTRSEIGQSLGIRFTYDPTFSGADKWMAETTIDGQPTQNGSGSRGAILGFNQNTGYFAPTGLGDSYIFFSLDNSLQNSSIVGQFTPYGDQPGRHIPVRNFAPIYSLSSDPYYE